MKYRKNFCRSVSSLLWIVWTVSLLAGWAPVRAQWVDTVSVYSPSMDKQVKNLVILPEGYEADPARRYPVVYLLHGYNNRYDSWLRKTKPELPRTATAYGTIIVCPDGASSWYWDSPKDPSYRYETFGLSQYQLFFPSGQTNMIPFSSAIWGRFGLISIHVLAFPP